MFLLNHRKKIRLIRRKVKNIFFLLNRRKKVSQKWKLTSFLGSRSLLKRTFVRSKHVNMFAQKTLKKKIYIFKSMLSLYFSTTTFNLCIFTKSKADYVNLKNEINFSELMFDFWFLNKSWMLKLFKQNRNSNQLSKACNGALLVIKCKTLKELLSNFALFNQPQSICSGFLLQNRFFWPEEFFSLIGILEQDCNFLSLTIGIIATNIMSQIFYFCLQVERLYKSYCFLLNAVC